MIRTATAADVGAVVALERQVFGPDAWSEALVTEAVAAGQVLVSSDGYAVVSVSGDVADLQRIAVAPGVRRRGAGRALLTAVVDAAIGSERVLLEVRADNDVARAFYADAGFAEIDRRRRYYGDGADALVLSLALPQGR